MILDLIAVYLNFVFSDLSAWLIGWHLPGFLTALAYLSFRYHVETDPYKRKRDITVGDLLFAVVIGCGGPITILCLLVLIVVWHWDFTSIVLFSKDEEES